MICKLAEFRVKRNKVKIYKRAIQKFLKNVRAKEAGTLVYESYYKPDGVSFIHLMCFKNKSSMKRHETTPHVREFVKVLYPICTRRPAFTDLNLIASKR